MKQQVTGILCRFSVVLCLALASEGRAQQPRPAPPPPKPAPAPPSRHGAFDAILAATVRDGLVDYESLATKHRVALTAYLDGLASMDMSRLRFDERFAAYINLYNATMLEAVLEHRAEDAKWTPAKNDFAVFKEARVRMRSKRISLNALENDIMRAQILDWRLHVALVCAAKSCPPLLARAYEAADLDRVLTEKWRRFLADTERNRVDHEKKVFALSKIFEWYAADFGDEAGLRRLLVEHFGKATASYRITTMDYSWQLNERVPDGRERDGGSRKDPHLSAQKVRRIP